MPEHQQGRARQTGLLLAGGMRLLLLLAIGWIISLKKEIYERLEGETGHASRKVAPTFTAVLVQVMILDLVFSIDSVITAVGMTPYIGVMIAVVLISVIIMLVAAKGIYGFINRHPTVKMLALSFLLLIGVTLIAEGLGQKIPKGYIYFAIAFSVIVEVLNIRAKSKARLYSCIRPMQNDACMERWASSLAKAA